MNSILKKFLVIIFAALLLAIITPLSLAETSIPIPTMVDQPPYFYEPGNASDPHQYVEFTGSNFSTYDYQLIAGINDWSFTCKNTYCFNNDPKYKTAYLNPYLFVKRSELNKHEFDYTGKEINICDHFDNLPDLTNDKNVVVLTGDLNETKPGNYKVTVSIDTTKTSLVNEASFYNGSLDDHTLTTYTEYWKINEPPKEDPPASGDPQLFLGIILSISILSIVSLIVLKILPKE